MRTRILASAILLGLAAAGAGAAPTAVVEGVQMPAWIERGGVKQPLSPGMELRASDKVSTGRNSRLLLRLAEGSEVKLGENALLSLDALGQRQENRQTLVQAALAVARGAFRFTTAAKSKLVSRREIDIRVSTVTAGIRGTDLWGKSGDDRDIVCLIEGRISVQREAEAAVTMDQASQFFIAPKAGGRPDPSRPAQLATVDAQQIRQWGTETDIAAGQGAARRGGKWKVVAASSEQPGVALMVVEKLRTEGYAAAVFPVGKADKRTYEARVDGLPSRAEAEALADRLEPIIGVKGRAAT
jgi:hypothetical protein